MNIKDIIIRLVLSVIIGGMVGYDREYKNRPAGFRTHILVCIGSTVAALIEIQSINLIMKQLEMNPELVGILKIDLGRLSAQVISGVGFLGAGTIIRNNGSVKGLTTAASIWAVACVGLAIGMGLYTISILSTFAILIALIFLKAFQNKFIIRQEKMKFEVRYDDKINAIREIDEILIDSEVNIRNIEFKSIDNISEGYKENICIYTILVPRNVDLNLIISQISMRKDILEIRLLSKGNIKRFI